jgi:hypothetical protein
MKIVCLAILIFLLWGCRSVEDKKCDTNFIGVWQVDTVGLHNDYKNIIVKRNWLTLKLIADSNGTFRLTPSDKYLKQCDGKWYATYNSEDDGCVLNYKEDYYSGYISVVSGFSINGSFEDATQFIIPFRKK